MGKFLLDRATSALNYALPFLGVIEPNGALIAASANLAMLPLNAINQKINDKQILQAMKFEFENLNAKMDRYNEEQKYNIWASSVFSKPEKNIKLGWEDYKTTIKAMFQSKTNEERDRHRNHFISTYKKYLPAIRDLNRLLVNQGASFSYNLGDLLAPNVKCHEKDLIDYTDLIKKLIYKGIMMNEFYYKVEKIPSKARVDEEAMIAYTSSQVMFKIHMECIMRSMHYALKDVELLINSMTPRAKMAEDVRRFLETTYGRYDWMVVAFITTNSKHRITETMNKHVLAGFKEVRKDYVSVAIARQAKGTHTKALVVGEAIKGCVPSNTVCYKVREKLGRCTTKVVIQQGVQVPVTSTYSAVHAYTRSAHDSSNTQEVTYNVMAYPEEYSTQTPFIYRGPCQESPGIKRGKFVVLIKSDEELLNSNPCATLNCGGDQRGRCVPVPDVSLAMCECRLPYYGRHCEKSLEDYKKLLQRETGPIVMDSRRFRP